MLYDFPGVSLRWTTE